MSQAVVLSKRDLALLRLFDLTPANAPQIRKASVTFGDEPFRDERRVRERLQTLGDAGLVRSYPAAIPGGGVMSYIRNGCDRSGAGQVHWIYSDHRRSSVAFGMSQRERDGVLNLSYQADGEPIRICVSLQTTRTQFGGWRWWFTCPLSVGGVPCHRRAGKLFLPPGARLFGCRECHRLSYRSSQEAHGMERLSARLGLAMDTSRLCAESLRKST